MRAILSFIAGAVFGAIALFIYLRQVGISVPPPAPAVTVVAPAATVPAATAPGMSLPSASLPAVTVVTDLSEMALPLRPDSSIVTSQAATTPAASAPAAPAPAKLMVPVEGFKMSQLSDNFDQPRGKERHHEALDIMAPKGSKVLAVADGKVVKLFNSKPGGLTVYQFDPSETHAYYYAHLDRYADGIKEGSIVKRGELIGYVGSTGNASADAPHLHFAVVALTPEKQWWKGTPLNPFPLLGD
jgi:murein DD-endopeptidase MepM/ murein hydrolase activator NlpD